MNKDKLFQFTHPCGCDPHVVATINLIAGFNSRTRVGATVVKVLCSLNRIVSIHAPVWVRPLKNGLRTHSKGFQFTHPCGCDPRKCLCGPSGRVSIHAPVWVRLFTTRVTEKNIWFQFTHPCGCDSLGRRPPRLAPGFQFTHPCGCDPEEPDEDEDDGVSIHAPVWVRLIPATTNPSRQCFNSRTRVGAT